MVFDQQKLQKLIQHNLICTAIIFFSYITLFVIKITFLFFLTKKVYISIDDRNVSGEPLMHHEDFKSLKFAIYNQWHGDFYQKKRN